VAGEAVGIQKLPSCIASTHRLFTALLR